MTVLSLNAGPRIVRHVIFPLPTIFFSSNLTQKQDKSSDIEQQPPFGDRKISNIQSQNRRGVTKPTGTSFILTKYEVHFRHINSRICLVDLIT